MTDETGCLDHVAFQVSEFEPVLTRLERLGVAYETAFVGGVSMNQVFFKDPTGIRIEVNCFIATDDRS